VALVPGSNAGPYRIIEPLGRGGMASVYRAYEAALDRYVALKVLPREFLHDPGFAKRFEIEAKAIARLEHPNIVPIYAYDIDREDGIPWMAMRLIDGGSLSQLIKGGGLSLPRSVAILRGVADALDYAHGKGIVHRDVKPQNVLLDVAGRVYLADFGIAKMVEASGGLTATGMITGTPHYMAPEQATGKNLGPAVDVYALGIMAYEMFTGGKPFDADTPVAILIKHMQDPLPIPSPSTVPEPLLRPLLKCTAKKAEDRWPSAGAFAAALEAALTAPTAQQSALPTVEAPLPSGPTVPVRTAVSAPTAPVPRPTVQTSAPPISRASLPPPLPAPPRAAVPAQARAGVSAPARAGVPAVWLGLAGVAVAVVLVAGGAALLWLRGGEPAPAPSPKAGVVTQPSPVTPASPERTSSSTKPTPAASTPSPTTVVTTPARAPTGSVPQRASSVVSPVATPAPTAAVPTPAPAPTVDPEITQLAAALGQGDAGSRWRAAQALGSYRAEAAPAVPSLVSALADTSPEVRWRSAEALGLVGAPAAAAVPALARCLSDTDPLVRTEATKALGLIGPSASLAVSQLARGLAASDVAIRRESARALARVGAASAPAVSSLVSALGDKDKFVRMESARALGRVGPSAREALPALTAAARDPELLVSREAQAALKAIGN
jgi:serine/threonine-protein kinase